jgi:hypothetical protein
MRDRIGKWTRYYPVPSRRAIILGPVFETGLFSLLLRWPNESKELALSPRSCVGRLENNHKLHWSVQGGAIARYYIRKDTCGT